MAFGRAVHTHLVQDAAPAMVHASDRIASNFMVQSFALSFGEENMHPLAITSISPLIYPPQTEESTRT